MRCAWVNINESWLTDALLLPRGSKVLNAGISNTVGQFRFLVESEAFADVPEGSVPPDRSYEVTRRWSSEDYEAREQI